MTETKVKFVIGSILIWAALVFCCSMIYWNVGVMAFKLPEIPWWIWIPGVLLPFFVLRLVKK